MKFDGITAEAERLFVRLIIKADDYGRYHAEPRLLRSGCYPLSDNLRANDLSRWLDELSTRQLIFRYETGGRSLLAIFDFRQRLKQSRAKFPPPDGKPGDFLPVSADFREVPGSSGKFPPDSDSDSDSDSDLGSDNEAETKRASAPIQSGEDWIAALKGDATYAHVQIDRELGKMRQWLALPANKGRQLTRRFALNWINKIEPPLPRNGNAPGSINENIVPNIVEV